MRLNLKLTFSFLILLLSITTWLHLLNIYNSKTFSFAKKKIDKTKRHWHQFCRCCLSLESEMIMLPVGFVIVDHEFFFNSCRRSLSNIHSFMSIFGLKIIVCRCVNHDEFFSIIIRKNIVCLFFFFRNSLSPYIE